MLQPYYGEFLISPVPLELSGNYCSHKCLVCFANLDVPNRRMDVRQTMGLLAKFHQRDTLSARLLQLGAPVCISNHVDPFSATNWRLMRPVFETLTHLGNGVQVQTRGAPDGKPEWIDEALAILAPSVWYVSVAMLDDDIRRRVEPGAPSIESRFRLIDRLRSAGHRVVAGFNPALPEWEPNPEELLRRLADAGAEGVWIERLHLNRQQEAEMSERERAAVTQDLIEKAKKRRTPPDHMDYIMRARHAALEQGLEVFGIGQPCHSWFFRPYQEVYTGRVFPTLQDWVNHCYEENWRGVLIPFEVFANFFLTRMVALLDHDPDAVERELLEDDRVHRPLFPPGVWPIDNYLGAIGHNVFRDRKIPPRMTFRQLLAIIWSEPRFKMCPARMGCFAYASVWDERDPAGWVQLVDERKMPYLLFDPEGFGDYYAQVEGLGIGDVDEVQLARRQPAITVDAA